MAQLKDFIRRMTINGDSATNRVDVNGATEDVCSTSCLTALEADPGRDASRPMEGIGEQEEPTVLEQHEPPHTTWGFLTSPKFGAAGSGGLEYERLPEAHRPGRR